MKRTFIILFLFSVILNFYFCFTKLNNLINYTGEYIVTYDDISYNVLQPGVPTLEDSIGRKLYHRASCPIVLTMRNDYLKAVNMTFIEKYNFLPCKSCKP